MRIPFERQDIRATTGIIRTKWGPVSEGTPFIAFYDQVYGSLRLSGRFLDREVASSVLEKVVELESQDGLLRLDEASLKCASALADDLANGAEAEVVPDGASVAGATDKSRYTPVLAPGGRGVNQVRNNEDFTVEGVFLSPSGLRYRGRHPSDTDRTVTVTVPVDSIIPTPGEPLAVYDTETGELVPLERVTPQADLRTFFATYAKWMWRLR
jgi:DEAD/DEAH box helicase domain-containing protein